MSAPAVEATADAAGDDGGGLLPAGITMEPAPAGHPSTLDDIRVDTYAHVLHDEPLQLVIAAMLRLEGVPAQYRLPAVTRSIELLERTVERQRHLVHAMGIAAAGDTLATVVRRDATALLDGRGARIDITGAVDTRLDAPVEKAARDILFAALCQIRLRGTVTEVRLDLRAVDGHLVLTLGDDGHGRIDHALQPAPPGVADLRAHAAAVGGTLDVGPGTTLTLTLPAATPAEPAGIVAPGP